MDEMASQITSLTIVYSTVSKNISHLRVTGLCAPWPVNSRHKWPVTRKCFHLMTSSWPFCRCRRERSQILIHMSVALLLAHLIFLVGIKRTHSRVNLPKYTNQTAQNPYHCVFCVHEIVYFTVVIVSAISRVKIRNHDSSHPIIASTPICAIFWYDILIRSTTRINPSFICGHDDDLGLHRIHMYTRSLSPTQHQIHWSCLLAVPCNIRPI